MPRINVEIWLSNKELERFKKEFQAALDDPDTIYTEDEFDEWIGDKLLDKWRRIPINKKRTF